MNKSHIIDGVRSPIGVKNGQIVGLRPDDLAAQVVKSLLKRNVDYSNEINKVIELDEQRKKIQTNLDSLLSESNTIAKSIGDLFKSGKIEEAKSFFKIAIKI